MLLGKLFHSSIPLLFDFVKSPVDVSFHLFLFAGEMFLLSFSLVFGDFSAGRRGCGGRCEGGDGFLGFESSLVWDSNRERWRGRRLLFDRGFWSTVRSEGSEKAQVLFVVGLMEVTMWALIEAAVFLPVSQLVTVGAERSSAVFFGYRLEVSEEG